MANLTPPSKQPDNDFSGIDSSQPQKPSQSDPDFPIPSQEQNPPPNLPESPRQSAVMQSQSLDNAEHPSGQFKSSGVYDLSDPTALELLIEDDNIPTYDSEKGQEIHNAQKTLLSVEMSRQKGVEISGNKVTVPGRVSLTLFTLLEILFCTLGFVTGMMHFAIMSPNYRLAVLVMSVIMFLQIIIYHSSYRAMRKVMAGIHVFGAIGIMTLCGWAFIDHIIYPPKENMPFFILCLSLFNFILIPILMALHFFWLGRGSRQITLKRKKSAANTPTKILNTSDNSTK